ncbi:MAG TPA: hypothetical protein VFP28_09900, partial [Gemmatimonadales bacterium]|nr:hypothetical protein [Gemmatimonadales bacterium]
CGGEPPQAPRAGIPSVETDAVADVTLAPFDLRSRHAAAPAFGSACGAAPYRRFDFWLGQWEIEDFAGGEPPVDGGDDIITSELGGCAVFENYAGGGFVGRSMNTIDPVTGQWHQHWSDNTGLVLDLAGAPTAAGMLLEGDRPTPSGTIHDRIEWTARSSTEVRQLWQFSNNGGPLAVQFDGLYHKRASVTLDPEVPTTACQDPAFPAPRQFDFTLGRWKVDLDGPLAEDDQGNGLRSTIATDLSGCLLEEKITGDDGYEARVFSSGRRRTGQWFRTFVDNRGLRVFLTGRQENGAMVLSGQLPTGGTSAADVRVTWQQLPGGRFRQDWQVTRDGGATWRRLLTATYKPR